MSPMEYRAARVERGSQVAVAAKLGVDRNTITRREMGSVPVTMEAARALLSLRKLSSRQKINMLSHNNRYMKPKTTSVMRNGNCL
jgi:helix-turn-helix protein